jgi:hypothetical protein
MYKSSAEETGTEHPHAYYHTPKTEHLACKHPNHWPMMLRMSRQLDGMKAGPSVHTELQRI